MVRSFRIHNVLHWDEDRFDDIAVWSFALDHVIWLCNKNAQSRCGLVPLKMVTSCKVEYTHCVCTHI